MGGDTNGESHVECTPCDELRMRDLKEFIASIKSMPSDLADAPPLPALQYSHSEPNRRTPAARAVRARATSMVSTGQKSPQQLVQQKRTFTSLIDDGNDFAMQGQLRKLSRFADSNIAVAPPRPVSPPRWSDEARGVAPSAVGVGHKYDQWVRDQKQSGLSPAMLGRWRRDAAQKEGITLSDFIKPSPQEEQKIMQRVMADHGRRRRRVMERLLRYENHYSSGAEGYPPKDPSYFA